MDKLMMPPLMMQGGVSADYSCGHHIGCCHCGVSSRACSVEHAVSAGPEIMTARLCTDMWLTDGSQQPVTGNRHLTVEVWRYPTHKHGSTNVPPPLIRTIPRQKRKRQTPCFISHTPQLRIPLNSALPAPPPSNIHVTPLRFVTAAKATTEECKVERKYGVESETVITLFNPADFVAAAAEEEGEEAEEEEDADEAEGA